MAGERRLRTGMWLLSRPEWTRGRARSRAAQRVRHGRFLAENAEPVAVLLIGARINRWRSVRSWSAVFLAMPGMLRELSQDPDSGLLGYRLLWGPRLGEVTLVQYWRRAGDVRAFAHDAERLHRPAQERFWKRYFRGNGAIGIWHELYSIRPGAYQCLYGDMPLTGLGAVLGLQPAVPGESGGYRASPDPVFAAQIADTR